MTCWVLIKTTFSVNFVHEQTRVLEDATVHKTWDGSQNAVQEVSDGKSKTRVRGDVGRQVSPTPKARFTIGACSQEIALGQRVQ